MRTLTRTYAPPLVLTCATAIDETPVHSHSTQVRHRRLTPCDTYESAGRYALRADAAADRLSLCVTASARGIVESTSRSPGRTGCAYSSVTQARSSTIAPEERSTMVQSDSRMIEGVSAEGRFSQASTPRHYARARHTNRSRSSLCPQGQPVLAVGRFSEPQDQRSSCTH